MEECSVLIETTKSAEDKTSRWFDLPIDYELFRDLLGVEADSKDYQITDMKLPFAGDIVRTTSVRRLNKLYFAYTDLSPEVQQAYKELIPYCGGVEDLLQKSEEFLFYPECHNIMDVARYRLEHNIEFSALSEKGKKYFSVASGGGTGRTLHPDNMAAGPASYGMTDTLGRMHSDAQFAGSSSVPAHVEMMGLIGAGNNPMVGMTVAVAVSIEEAAKAGKF